MSLKNVSTGGGLVVVGLGLCAIAGAMVVSGSGGSAHAGVNASAASAVASAAMAQKGGEPVVVWMGVASSGDPTYVYSVYHRLWSDGRLEQRKVLRYGCDTPYDDCSSGWVEVPPPAGGDGFACRTDINGDRKTDAVDLAEILAAWGNQGGCEPEPTYPCFNLTIPLGLQAMK
jgi:hypothetical protein